MRKLVRPISLLLSVVFALVAVAGCSHVIRRTLPALDAPVVTVGADGVATWDAVDDALYYIYVIDEGEENLTDECRIQLEHNDSVKVKAVSGNVRYSDSEFSQYKTYIQNNVEKTKLKTPQVTVNASGIASWGIVADAQYYIYIINNGKETSTVERTVTLENDQSIKVKACSDEQNYEDSDYSQLKTFVNGNVQTKLAVPPVTVSSAGVATWNSVTGAQYYTYIIDDGDEIKTAACTVTLENGQSIKVKACSNEQNYEDSDYSQVKTFANGSVQTELGVPQVTIGTSGVATWSSISGAQYYVYVIDNGNEVKTTARTATLENGQSIKVKACSDDQKYVNSDYSQSKTYVKSVVQPTKLNTPMVTISSAGVATWAGVTGAQYYLYVINGGAETRTTSRTVTLSDKQTFKVKACSEDEKYVNSDFSQLKTYNKPTTPGPDVNLSEEVKKYYSSITATQGTELLGQLHDRITESHTYYTSYGECSESDYVNITDPGPNGGALEFYTQKSIMSFSGNIGHWNREHVWCKSLSNGMWKSVSNGTRNGGTDMHHIRPSESGLNSTRGSNKFGKVNGGKEAWSRNTSGTNVALGGHVGSGTFEPLDKVKGDVARIVLYVYTHYNTYANVNGTTNGSKSGVFGTLKFTNIMSASSESAAIQILIEWNELDPVDEIERIRNDEVCKIQGNRNPFIDHPEYVQAIWG